MFKYIYIYILYYTLSLCIYIYIYDDDEMRESVGHQRAVRSCARVLKSYCDSDVNRYVPLAIYLLLICVLIDE